MLDLDFWCWRERVTEDGEERLAPLHSDPHIYEYPLNFIWDTEEEAREWRDNWIREEEAAAAEDGIESEEAKDARGWVLVHYLGTVHNGGQ